MEQTRRGPRSSGAHYSRKAAISEKNAHFVRSNARAAVLADVLRETVVNAGRHAQWRAARETERVAEREAARRGSWLRLCTLE